jgi:predicted nucleotidyltransferase
MPRTLADLIEPDAESRLRAFKREVENLLPGQVTEMRLFGSRARGGAAAESDYDVAVFVRGDVDLDRAIRVLSDASYEHILDGYDIDAIGLPADYLSHGKRSELADDIARDGIPIS